MVLCSEMFEYIYPIIFFTGLKKRILKRRRREKLLLALNSQFQDFRIRISFIGHVSAKHAGSWTLLKMGSIVLRSPTQIAI